MMMIMMMIMIIIIIIIIHQNSYAHSTCCLSLLFVACWSLPHSNNAFSRLWKVKISEISYFYDSEMRGSFGVPNRISRCREIFENSPNRDCSGKNGRNGIHVPWWPTATEMQTRASRIYDVTIKYCSQVILVNGPSLTAAGRLAAKSNFASFAAHTTKYLRLFVLHFSALLVTLISGYTWHFCGAVLTSGDGKHC